MRIPDRNHQLAFVICNSQSVILHYAAMAERIGLYGGSFDPIHCGHVIAARTIAEQLDLERVIFLPSANPPHKPDHGLLDPAHRAKMVKLAIADDPVLEFSDFDLMREGPSYTIDTVAHFRQLFGHDAALHWIIGADSLAELTTWHRVSALVDACRIITAVRGGCEPIAWDQLRGPLSGAQTACLRAGFLQTPAVEISSTDIRRRVRRGRSIACLVPDRVCTYIAQHGLYRDTPPPG